MESLEVSITQELLVLEAWEEELWALEANPLSQGLGSSEHLDQVLGHWLVVVPELA